MIPAAIDDYLGGLLASWCTSVARWQAPGLTASTTCTCRRDSAFMWLVDPARWPHDLMHQLASNLDDAVREVAASFDAGSGSREAAERIVLAHVTRTAPDLIDVLEHCVSPRMLEFALSETVRGLRILEEAR